MIEKLNYTKKYKQVLDKLVSENKVISYEDPIQGTLYKIVNNDLNKME